MILFLLIARHIDVISWSSMVGRINSNLQLRILPLTSNLTGLLWILEHSKAPPCPDKNWCLQTTQLLARPKSQRKSKELKGSMPSVNDEVALRKWMMVRDTLRFSGQRGSRDLTELVSVTTRHLMHSFGIGSSQASLCYFWLALRLCLLSWELGIDVHCIFIWRSLSTIIHIKV